MMDVGETVGAVVGGIIGTIIPAIILVLIAHFVCGDNIYAVLFLYVIVASRPSALLTTSYSKSSVIFASILGAIIMFLIVNFAFTLVFGPNVGFPYSILGLGPVITGLILSLIINLMAMLCV